MLSRDYKDLIKETLSQLKYAEGELNRPSKDVVSISVCNSSRESMKAIMHVYLLSKGISVDTKNSIRDFLDLCIHEDKEFATIDMTCIGCQHMDYKACESKYCLQYNEVDACLTVANNVKDMVIKKMNINESALG